MLNASFRSRDEAVCLDLIQGLSDLCRKYNKPDLFVFNLRLSSDPSPQGRWTRNFFASELSLAITQEKTERIWACGPPVMQRELDLALDQLEV